MKTNQLEYLYSNINQWINNADGKLNIFIGVQLGIVGLLIKDFYSWYRVALLGMRTLEVLVSILGISLVLFSIYHSLRGIFPNLRSRGEKGELVYFGSIIRHSLSEYRKIVDGASEAQYKSDLVEQVYTNSHIAKDKFSSYKKSVAYFLSGITILLVTFLTV